MIKLVWLWTTLVCVEGGYYTGTYKTYIIEHEDKITYFKLSCPENEYKLVTEKTPNGITYIKEYLNEASSKRVPKQDTKGSL